MRNIIILLLIASPLIAQEHIVISEVQATQIRGNYGIYSAIEPVPTPDGMFIVPERCLTDKDLTDARITLQIIKSNAVTQNITGLPEVGQPVYKDSLYKSDEGLVKCVQTHNMTIYKPSEVPALFSFFRENSDDLLWIPNEQVAVNAIRIYNSVKYKCLQSHMTLSSWTPNNTPELWQEVISETCPEWVQPTGGHDAYNIGDCITYKGTKYESVIKSNVWSPETYPAGWKKL